MAKHMVKCGVCGKSFDTNVIQAVRYGARRYAHQSCDPDNTNVIPMEENGLVSCEELTELKDYINDIFGDKANWTMIIKQIKKFTKDNQYTYSGILKSLKWWYEINNNSIDKANGGIGIVEYIYQQAYDYFYRLYLAQMANEIKDIGEFEVRTFKIDMEPPQQKVYNFKLFNLEEEEYDE